jgi:hypothetical protein
MSAGLVIMDVLIDVPRNPHFLIYQRCMYHVIPQSCKVMNVL